MSTATRPGALTRIVEAALAASLDHDLEPAARCLRLVGCEVAWQCEEEIHWHGGPGIPAGGFAAGGDPSSTAVTLLFATLGELWALSAAGPATLAEVNRAWRERIKARPRKGGA